MITPSFGLTATERVLPKLALDFTTASLDSRITFARSLNTATRINSNGYIEKINADLPRFDYDPVTKICKGLLIEESRTNSLTHSETIATTWIGFGASISSGSVTSPEGAATSIKFVESVGVAGHGIYQTITTSGTVAFSVYAKYNGRRYLMLRKDNGAFPWVMFDLVDGVITQETSATGSISVGPAGFYRCTMVCSDTGNVVIKGSDTPTVANVSNTYNGDGVSGFYLYGPQLEAGAFPTSYIPTTTTSLTRNADVATMTGTNFSSWFNASEGAIQINASRYVQGVVSGVLVGFAESGVFDNSTYVENSTGSSANLTLTVFSGGGQQAIIGKATTLTSPFKLAFGYKLNNFAVTSGGQAVATDTSGIVSANPSVLAIGTAPWSPGNNLWNGHIRQIYAYPQRILNAELEAFSK